MAGGQDCGRHLEAVPAPGPATNLWPPLALRLGSPSGEPSPFLLVPALPETQVLVAIPQEAHPAQDGGAAGKATASLGAITQGLTLIRSISFTSVFAARPGLADPPPALPALSRFLPGDCPASGLKAPPGVRGWFLKNRDFWSILQTPLRSVAAMNPSPAAGEGPEAATLPRAGPRLPTVFHARLLTKARESWGFKAKSGFSAAVRVPPRRSASLQPTLPDPSTGVLCTVPAVWQEPKLCWNGAKIIPASSVAPGWPVRARGCGIWRGTAPFGLLQNGPKHPSGSAAGPGWLLCKGVLGHQGPKSASCGGDGDVVAPGGG